MFIGWHVTSQMGKMLKCKYFQTAIGVSQQEVRNTVSLVQDWWMWKRPIQFQRTFPNLIKTICKISCQLRLVVTAVAVDSCSVVSVGHDLLIPIGCIERVCFNSQRKLARDTGCFCFLMPALEVPHVSSEVTQVSCVNVISKHWHDRNLSFSSCNSLSKLLQVPQTFYLYQQMKL